MASAQDGQATARSSLQIAYRWERFRGPAIPQVVITQDTPAEKIPGHHCSYVGFGADEVLQYADAAEELREAEIRLGYGIAGDLWVVEGAQTYRDGSVDVIIYYVNDLLATLQEAADEWTASVPAVSEFDPEQDRTLWWEAVEGYWSMAVGVMVSDAGEDDPIWYFPHRFDVLAAAKRLVAMHRKRHTLRSH